MDRKETIANDKWKRAAHLAMENECEEDKNTNALKKVASAFKKEGRSFKSLRVQHERLWILRYFTIVGSIVFLSLQIWHTCNLQNDMSKVSGGESRRPSQ